MEALLKEDSAGSRSQYVEDRILLVTIYLDPPIQEICSYHGHFESNQHATLFSGIMNKSLNFFLTLYPSSPDFWVTNIGMLAI